MHSGVTVLHMKVIDDNVAVDRKSSPYLVEKTYR